MSQRARVRLLAIEPMPDDTGRHRMHIEVQLPDTGERYAIRDIGELNLIFHEDQWLVTAASLVLEFSSYQAKRSVVEVVSTSARERVPVTV